MELIVEVDKSMYNNFYRHLEESHNSWRSSCHEAAIHRSAAGLCGLVKSHHVTVHRLKVPVLDGPGAALDVL